MQEHSWTTSREIFQKTQLSKFFFFFSQQPATTWNHQPPPGETHGSFLRSEPTEASHHQGETHGVALCSDL